jgi:hypothetical protein
LLAQPGQDRGLIQQQQQQQQQVQVQVVMEGQQQPGSVVPRCTSAPDELQDLLKLKSAKER